MNTEGKLQINTELIIQIFYSFFVSLANKFKHFNLSLPPLHELEREVGRAAFKNVMSFYAGKIIKIREICWLLTSCKNRSIISLWKLLLP
jgi:hypothetical protein